MNSLILGLPGRSGPVGEKGEGGRPGIPGSKGDLGEKGMKNSFVHSGKNVKENKKIIISVLLNR